MTPAPKEADVSEALRGCIDPELGIDIVSLGLIYGISIAPERVTITMTLTTPSCPLVPYFRQQIIDRVQQKTGITDVQIDITFDPPWSVEKISAEAKKQLTMLRG
jgi:metal-sulfur cluster biosynthetic enzyme